MVWRMATLSDKRSMTSEEKARNAIDALVTASRWTVPTKDQINLSASRDVAICELSFSKGEPDYTLFVDGKANGTVEAKPAGHSLVGVEEQSAKYVTGVPLGLVAEVERRLSVVDELESVVSANLQRAFRLRQSILQKAFSGGLV